MRFGPVLLLLVSLPGCHLNEPDSPLAQAAAAGEAAEILDLVASGANPNACAGSGWGALHWAAREGQTSAMHVLLEAGADPDLEDCSRNHWPPLLHAVHMRRSVAATLLIDHGADVNFRSHGGLTALILAAGYGETDLVRRLLDHGADPYATAEDGTNALWAAAGGGALRDPLDGPPIGSCSPDTVRVLLDAAPDLSLRSGLTTELVDLLARSDECEEIVERLRENRNQGSAAPPRRE